MLPFLYSRGDIVLGDPTNIAGPYELLGTILVVLQFVFTFMMVIGKHRPIRLSSPFLAAGFGGAAFVVYYLNQTAVGNSLDARVLLITAAGLVYGLIFGILRLKRHAELKALRESSARADAEKNRRER